MRVSNTTQEDETLPNEPQDNFLTDTSDDTYTTEYSEA